MKHVVHNQLFQQNLDNPYLFLSTKRMDKAKTRKKIHQLHKVDVRIYGEHDRWEWNENQTID